MVALLSATETSVRGFLFGLAAWCALASALLLLTGDLARAMALAAVCGIAIVGISKVKFHHSARKLIAADFPLLFAGTVPFFFQQYRPMMLGVCAGLAASCAAAVAVVCLGAGDAVSMPVRIALSAVAYAVLLLAYRLCGGAQYFRAGVTEPGGYISTFAGAALDVAAWWPAADLRVVGTVVPFALASPAPARGDVAPDILLIQHESVFDPRLYGLPVEPEIAAFLSPPDGISGALGVEIYGGGSWQSEFSVLTGIPSEAFGNDAYFMFQKGVGRFHHALPQHLSTLGYRTLLASSCRRDFLNYDAFYRGIGMAERLFSEDFASRFEVANFEKTYSDLQFLPAVVDTYADKCADDPVPRFVYALTNFNHGPHSRRTAVAAFDASRAFALAALPDVEYAEYYARLAETAQAWKICKARIAARLPRRPLLIVHYGDHQPVMSRRLQSALGLSAEPKRTFTTFYAMEAQNFTPYADSAAQLDISLLGTRVLQAAGLPLDAISATRAALFAVADAATRATVQRRILQTMLDAKLVDLD